MTRNILELFNFERVNILLEGFNKTTGFVTAILDLEGNVLSQSGWRQICTKFHRVHPETAKRCTESDTVLAGKMAEGEKYHFYKCLNGLVDVAVPLMIKGEHIANLFSGQFFFEEPDREFFLKQAQKYSFDNNEYLESLEKVPVLSKEKVKIAMDFLLDMTQLITEMTYQKLEQTELKDAVIKSSTLIDTIIDNSSALIYVTDLEGKFQMVNKEMEILFNLPKEKIIGKHRQDFVSKEIAEQHINNDLTVIRSKKPITIEEENHAQDGRHFYLTQKFPLFDISAEVYAVGGISADITKRKNAEETLKKTTFLLNEAQRISHLGSWELDIVNNILFWSDEIYRLFEIDPKMFKASYEAFLDTIHPDDRDAVNFAYTNSIKNHLPYAIEHRLLFADGRIKYVREQCETYYDSDNKPISSVGTVYDITERKLAELALKRSEYVLKETQRISKIGGWEYDVELGETYYSDEVFNIYGLPENKMFKPEEGIAFYHPDDRPLVSDSFTIAITEGVPYDIEVRFINAQGENLWVRTAGKPVFENGKVVKVIGNLMDITERKNAEEKIRKFNEELEQLVKERTEEIVQKSAELERMNKLFIGRELRIKELRDKIIELGKSKQ